jgi:hypothetical protein
MKVHNVIPTVLVKEAGIKDILSAVRRFGTGMLRAPVNMSDEIFHGITGGAKGFSDNMIDNIDNIQKMYGKAGNYGEITGRALVPAGILAALTDKKEKQAPPQRITRTPDGRIFKPGINFE